MVLQYDAIRRWRLHKILRMGECWSLRLPTSDPALQPLGQSSCSQEPSSQISRRLWRIALNRAQDTQLPKKTLHTFIQTQRNLHKLYLNPRAQLFPIHSHKIANITQHVWNQQRRPSLCLRGRRPEKRPTIWDRAREEGEQIPRGKREQPQGQRFQGWENHCQQARKRGEGKMSLASSQNTADEVIAREGGRWGYSRSCCLEGGPNRAGQWYHFLASMICWLARPSARSGFIANYILLDEFPS